MTVGRPGVVGPGASAGRGQLEEERAFLLRSLEDLDIERAAGDLSDADYDALRATYTARAAAVLRQLEEMADDVLGSGSDEAPDPPARLARRRRKVFLWGGIGALAAAAVVLVATGVATRLPGQTATGSVSLDSTQQLQRTLAQAQALETSGKPAQALSLYHQVLQKDPTQEQALAESGWIEFEAGVSQRDASALSRGQRDEQAAERADPGAYAPHLYLGSMLLVEQRFADAADEFASFLASSPPAAGVQRAWPFIVRAYTAAGRPVPALPAH